MRCNSSFSREDNVILLITVGSVHYESCSFAGKHGSNFRSLGGEGVRSINGSVPDLRRETSEVYYFNGDLQPNAKTARQVFSLKITSVCYGSHLPPLPFPPPCSAPLFTA